MKHFYILGLILLFISISSNAQQVNLVVNPSFEELYGCPTDGGQIDSAVGWSTPIGGGGGNPDVYNICSTSFGCCGVPLNTDGSSFQYPHSGIGYAGFDGTLSFQGSFWREYIQSKLSRTLNPGESYCVAFYASLSDQHNAYITTLGAYFDNGSITAPNNYVATAAPQVVNTSQSLNDKINWMKIEGSFIASGTEQYITIGNFFTDDVCGLVNPGGTSAFWAVYYYIDDVSVIDAGLLPFAGNDTIIPPNDSIFIGRHSEVGLDEDCIWFEDGVAIDTIAGMWVKPGKTTTYILQQTICGNINYDTITVTVSGVGVDDYDISKYLKVYPNPASDAFYIEFSGNTTSEEMVLELYNVYGVLEKEVYINNKDKITVSTHDLPSGIYFYSIRLGNNTIEKDKIVIIK